MPCFESTFGSGHRHASRSLSERAAEPGSRVLAEVQPHEHAGNPSSTEPVSATLRNPALSKRRRVPTYAIVRFTFAPALSTGYPSTAGARSLA